MGQPAREERGVTRARRRTDELSHLRRRRVDAKPLVGSHLNPSGDLPEPVSEHTGRHRVPQSTPASTREGSERPSSAPPSSHAAPAKARVRPELTAGAPA